MRTLESVLEELPELTSFGIGIYSGTAPDQRQVAFDKERDELARAGLECAYIALWLRENVPLQMRINRKRSSYGLKHIAEDHLGYYVSNGKFIAAAIMAGYSYRTIEDWPNVYFGMNEKALKALDEERRRNKWPSRG